MAVHELITKQGPGQCKKRPAKALTRLGLKNGAELKKYQLNAWLFNFTGAPWMDTEEALMMADDADSNLIVLLLLVKAGA